MPRRARPSSEDAAGRPPSTFAPWRRRSRDASGRRAGKRISVVLESPAHRVAETPIETSRFKRKLADPEDFVVTLEVEPPKGVDVSAAIEGARAAKTCGVDAVNVTDNPMARLRMSSIAVAALVQRETGQEAVVQITTRDRNVLGLQSDLLGAAGLGVKAILCLGGDPLKIGDYPQAKQVSEVDVLGLLRIAKGLNAGADLAGNAIGAPTAFAIGCAANPAASDPDVEFSKIRAKVEAGAAFAQTQPVYDVRALEAFFGHAGSPGDPDADRPDPAAVTQADALLRERSSRHRRAGLDHRAHAAGQ